MTQQDLKLAARALKAQPGVAIVVVLSLALGIGINVTLFSLINEVLLRPPAVDSPHELVRAFTSRPGGEGFESTSYLDYRDLEEQSETLEGLAAHCMAITSFTRGDRTDVILGEMVTGNYFEVLGVKAARGRVFDDNDETSLGANAVAVVGHDFWQQKLDGAENVVGSDIRLNGRPFRVVGVLPPEFGGILPGADPTIYVPVTMAEVLEPAGQIDSVPSPTGSHRLDRRGYRFLWLIGRRTAENSLAGVAAELETIMARLNQSYPQTNKDLHMRTLSGERVRLHPEVDRYLAPTAALLLVVVGVLMLVVCGNVANMLLARASRRRQEMAVRLALGAGRGRLVRLLLVENALLAALGGLGGLLLAAVATRLLMGFQPAALPIKVSLDLPIDHRVALYTLLLSGGSALIFGLAPAWVASRTDVMRQMRREELRPKRFGLGQALVAAQVALCLALLVSSGLLVRSLIAVNDMPLGIDAPRLGIVTTDLGMIDYDTASATALERRMVDEVAALPGVLGASWADRVPLDFNLMADKLFIEGYNEADEEGVSIDSARIAADYFDALEVEILEGRAIDERDSPDSPRVAVVSQAFAERYLPRDGAVGKRLRDVRGREITVVGVAADYKVRTVGESPRPMVHLAAAQAPNTYGNLVFRTEGGASNQIEAVRRAMQRLEPRLIFLDAQTLDQRLGITLFPLRFGSGLLVGVSALTALLAAIGLYGLVSFWVAARRREIAIRMAVGAKPREVTGLVVRRGFSLTLVGMVFGLLLAVPIARMLRGVLLGVGPADPLSFLSAALLLLALTFLANALPASRAANIDPIRVLREE